MNREGRPTAHLTAARLALVALAAAVVAILAWPRAGAAQSGTCIDDVTGRTNTCTANDVRVSELRNSENLSCEAGSQVELNLRARLVATAFERYDIGTFVALDGGNARTGICQHDYLPPPLSAGGTCSGSGEDCHWDGDCPAGEACTGGYDPLSGSGPLFNAEADVDGDDQCGDLEQAVETFYDLVTVTVPCEDSDGDGYLNVGVCVSWDHQKSTTCVDVSGAVPGNKAKCRCEMAPVGNVIVQGVLEVSDVPQPDTVPEPGGDVLFTVVVENPSPQTITLSGLEDSVYGDLAIYPGSSCSLPQTLGSTAAYTCTLTAPVAGPPGAQINTVTATGTDAGQQPVSDTAVTQVVIIDLLPAMDLTKTAEPPSLREPGGTVIYSVDIRNTTSPPEAVVLSSLLDSLYGDVTDPANPNISDSTCQLVTIGPAGTYQCSFRTQVSGPGGTVIRDTLTATGEDDEGNPAQATGEAAVDITSSLALEVTKGVEPDCVASSGAEARYQVAVANLNQLPLDLISLADDIYGDLANPGNPKISDSTCDLVTIEPSSTYTCTFSAPVVFETGELSQTDTITAQASDRAGSTASGQDAATVGLCAIPPDTGVPLPPPLLAGGLAALGFALVAVGVWLRLRAT